VLSAFKVLYVTPTGGLTHACISPCTLALFCARTSALLIGATGVIGVIGGATHAIGAFTMSFFFVAMLF